MSDNKIDLNYIFENDHIDMLWLNDNQPTHTVRITNLDRKFLIVETTCYIANGFGLPRHIEHYINDMITEESSDVKIHFSFKLPGIMYRQSLYLHIHIEKI